jgi:hypothetical protein
VRPTALTAGCTTVAVVLGVLGMYLDSLAAAAGAVGLTALSGGSLSLFVSNDPIRGLPSGRTGGRKTVGLSGGLGGGQGQGHDPGCAGPSGPAQRSSASICSVRSRRGPHPQRRGAIPGPFMTPGDVSFRGLLLETADRFFSMTSVCTLSCCVGETVTVLPAESRIPRACYRGQHLGEGTRPIGDAAG